MHWHTATFRKFLILIIFISFFCVAAFAQQTATPTITALFKFTLTGTGVQTAFSQKANWSEIRDGKFYGAAWQGRNGPSFRWNYFSDHAYGHTDHLVQFRFRWQWTISQRRNSIRKSGARAGWLSLWRHHAGRQARRRHRV